MHRIPFNEGWQSRPKVDRFAELAGAAGEWTPVLLPHDAMIGTDRTAVAGPANAYFPGGAWEYRRTIDLTEERVGDRLVLEFEGVYRDAVVYVNGTIAARRSYGYSGFFVTIDHLLHVGDDNEIKVECMAHEDSRWYSGAGIYRDVWLWTSGPVHLVPGRLEVLTPEVDDDGAVVTVVSVVRNTSGGTSNATLVVDVVDPEGEVVATEATPVTAFPGDELVARLRLHVRDPRRWSPDDPTLYVCRVTLREGDDVIDGEVTTLGIRSLTLDPLHGLRVNGAPVLLRGACVHHDNGPLGSATIARAEERRVELLKAAGFNALRSAHNPMSRAMLDACDRMGMLVMDETFDMWGQTKTSDDYALRFDDCWEPDVEAMVRRDVKHPSVILYSIGNEIPDGSTPSGLHRGRALAEKVRGLDPSRYVTQAVTGMLVAGPGIIAEIREIAAERMVDAETGVNTAALNLGDLMNEAMRAPVVAEMTAEAFSYLDVAGYNYMDTRFEVDAEHYPNRLIVGTETHPDRIDVGWSAVTRLPQVIGDFVWTGWDYLGEVGIGRVEHGDPAEAGAMGMSAFHGEYPWIAAHCGDIDITGHRRPQSYYREIVFGLRADPYVAVQRPELHGRAVTHSSPWSWTDVVASWSWSGHEGAPLVVEVYADADEVELLVNGRSVGRQPAGPDHRFRAEFETEYEPGELVAVAWRSGEAAERTTLRSATGPVSLAVTVDRSEITGDVSDLAYVEIMLVDEAGTLHNTADRLVTVEVDGPGVLQGVASGNPTTEEPFAGPTCSTFDGRALAVIRPTGAGALTVRVTADECASQEIRIDAQ